MDASPNEDNKINDSLDAIKKFASNLGPDDIYKEILIEELLKILNKKNS